MSTAKKDGHGDVSFEPTDVASRPVALFTLGLVVITAIVALALVGFHRLLASHDRARQETVVLRPPAEREFPKPRLEVSPVEDLAAFRAREDAILDGWGWVEPDKGIVRIPVAEAMRLVAERGLPAWPAVAPAPAATSAAPTDKGVRP